MALERHRNRVAVSNAKSAPARKPTLPQRQWLLKGATQPDGKLPLFLDDGRRVCERTVQTCIDHGWAEPCFANPSRPGWQVCRLTEEGRLAIG